MKTRMLRWLARVALSLVAIAAWGTGGSAQSLSGVYGGEQCPYRLTFRGKDVVYIQFLAGGKVMQELPGQYKVDGDKVVVTAPSWGAVFTQKGTALETPAMGRTMVCTKLSDVAWSCDQFGPTYNRGNMCFDTRPTVQVTVNPFRVQVGNEMVRESVVVSEAKGGSGWRPDQSQGAVRLLWPANASPVMPSPALLLLKVSAHGETVEARAMFPSNVSTFTDAAVNMAKQLNWRTAVKDGKAVEAWVRWEFRAVAEGGSGFITVNVSGGPALVYIDGDQMEAPVTNYRVTAGLHRIQVLTRGGSRVETVQVDSGATVVKSYDATGSMKVVFTVQPSNAGAGAAITPEVQATVQNAQGNTVTTATTRITVAIGTNPASGTLAGTTTVAAVNGVATFANVSINNPGSGYTLTASATGLTGATSSSFNITAARTWAAVSAGAANTCGVTTSGEAYCWGYNDRGQLGNGTTTNSATPAAVSGGLTFATVSVGYSYTCGVTTSGEAYCWGLNDRGELGNSTTTNSLTPVAVSGGLTFTAVSAGQHQTCGVTTSVAADCWGSAAALGNGRFNGPGNCPNGGGFVPCSTIPVAVSGGLTFASVSSGLFYACGVTPSGAAYCWGLNGQGELGNGTTTPNATPVAVSGGLTFASVSANSRSFHTCGVTTSGAAYCWGRNGQGELGNGTTTTSLTPVAVSGGLTFAAVSVGDLHTCGVTTSGAAYCWGYNGEGDLGNGTTTSSLTPVAASGGLTFASVSAGSNYTCGVTPTGAAYCWGYNAEGELGNDTTMASLTPVAVSGGLAVAAKRAP